MGTTTVDGTVMHVAGSDGRFYDVPYDERDEFKAAAEANGIKIGRVIRTKDKEGNVHKISEFDEAGVKAARDRGDSAYYGEDERPYTNWDLVKWGFESMYTDPTGEDGALMYVGKNILSGLGNAVTIPLRGLAHGTVGLGIKALQGTARLGEGISNLITGEDDHFVSEGIGKVHSWFNSTVEKALPDFFEKRGFYDAEGGKTAQAALNFIPETVGNLKGIGKLTKVLQTGSKLLKAGEASAKAAHATSGAMFGTGSYGELAADPNGPGGWRQETGALVAGATEGVFFGLWNPLKISDKFVAEAAPFMEATWKEATKRVTARMVQSGATMAAVEAAKQGSMAAAGAGTDSAWGEITADQAAKEVLSQFLVGSAFAAVEAGEANIGRFSYGKARKAQGEPAEGFSDNMKVAMSYQVEKNRKAYAPKYHQQAVYAYNRFVKQGGRAESFKEGLSQSPDVRRVNEDGSVVFRDGSVWRMDPRTLERGNGVWGATITVSDGTILSERGELLGYRPRAEAEEGVKPREAGAEARSASGGSETGMPDAEGTAPAEKAESNALLLLAQMDAGRLPVVELATDDIAPIAPTDNGNTIAEYDAEKAKPIVVLEDLEGNMHALTGGKRLATARAAGVKSVKAVIVREADGWTADEAAGLGATENLREGRGTLKNILAATETLGAEKVSELAAWHQKNGSREFASSLRRGLSVAAKGTPELKDALATGLINDTTAYNAAQVLSLDRVGESWEAAQREFADLASKVGPEELDAVLWGLKRRADGGEAVDWKAAIAEERAKYNAKKGAKEGAIDSDSVVVETADGGMKTLGEIESEMGRAGGGQTAGGIPGRASETPAYDAAESAGGNKAVELRPVEGKDGQFTTLAFPEVKVSVDGSSKTVAVDGLKPEDFEGGNLGRGAAFVAKIEAFARERGLKIAFYDQATEDLWRAAKAQIKAEGERAYATRQLEAKRTAIVDRLKKSGLAAEVVESGEEFMRKMAEAGAEPIKAGEEVYAYCDPATKKVYLNPEFFATRQALEAPIHEFGHLAIIATEKANKAVYDRGMKLATDMLDDPEKAGSGAIREIVDFVLKDNVYSRQGRKVQAEELLAQLIGRRGIEALKNETDKTLAGKIKSWLVDLWRSFGGALGIGDITPEQAEKMTIEEVADAIRAEMMSGKRYGERSAGVEFAGGGAKVATRPARLRRRLTGRRKAVDDFVKAMGGGEDPTNTDTDLLALWVDSGGRLFDAMPFEIETGYSKGATGVKTTRRAVADEFAESAAFYKGLDAAQRRVFFGVDKLEAGAIGESFAQRLKEAGITRFTNEDGTVDYEAAIDEFKRQWTNYERGEEVLKERGEWQEERDRAYVEEMERAEQAEYEAVFGKDETGATLAPEAASAQDAEIAADLAAGRFSKGGVRFSRAMVNGQETAVANGHPLSKKDAKDPEKVLAVLSALVGKSAAQLGEMKLTRINEKSIDHLVMSDHAQVSRRQGGNEAKKLWRGTVGGMSVIDDIVATSRLGNASGANHQNKDWKKNATFYTAKTRFAIESESGYEVYPCNLVVVELGNGERYVYDLTDIGKPTHTAKVKLTTATPLGQTSQEATATAVSANPTAQSIPQIGAGAQGGLRFSRGGIFTGTAADYANRSRQGGKDDGPSLKKIGTGERSQVYGWGLYGSTVRGVAEGYATLNSGAYLKNGKPISDYFERTVAEALDDYGWDVAKTISGLQEKNKTLGTAARKENNAIIKELRAHGEEYRRKSGSIYEQTFFTDRAPGDESHLLKWYEPVSEETWDIIREAERANGTLYNDNGTMLGLNQGYVLERDGKPVYPKVTGQSLYETLAKELGSPQAASEFLARAGIDGVKYPVDSYGGKTVKDGDKAGWNYVSFRDDNIRVDHKWTDGQLRFSRAVKPSKLGDGKQRYYEVPFDKAVDKIVKAKKPVSDEHVFISETPQPFKEIGIPGLPVMMNQSHVLSCYFGKAEGIKGGNMHGLRDRLKSLPRALAKPMMIIANESNPSSSVIAIVKMQDRDGHTVIAPVEINGIGRSNDGPITANIVKSAFGKKNLWSEKVAKALRDEVDGKVAVFYVDSNEARTIENRLAREAFDFGKSERQLLSVTKGTVHSIADFGSPVKGVGAQTDSQQFKRWFDGSKVVDANGEPLKVWHGSTWDPMGEPNGSAVFRTGEGETGSGAHFGTRKAAEERGADRKNWNLTPVYLNIKNPLRVEDTGYWTPGDIVAEVRKTEKDFPWLETWDEIKAELKRRGYDGMVYKNVVEDEGSDSYIAFEPNQIKSATDNIGTFDAGNNDIRFSRGDDAAPEAEYVRLTRVADDAGAGERTPGAIAASRELSRQGAVPLTTKGTRYLSLPLSEMNALARYLTGHALPAEMQSGRKIGAPGKASTKHRRLTIAADILGTVDKSDMAAEKAALKSHGYFANEDAGWASNHSKAEIRSERERSEEALSSRLEKIADRRARGAEPGGQAAARRVYADQLAKVVMAMPHGQPGVLGNMQTVAGALEKRVRGNDAEADAFLDWMNGGAPAEARSAQDRKAEMFAAFLMMPKEMETRAKGWYDAMRSTIAGDRKLAEAFRKMTARMMTEQGYGHIQAEILKAQDAETEAAIQKLNAEANEPIKAGGARDIAKETVILACDDRMGAATVRVDAATRNYIEAQKAAMKLAKTEAERAAIKQQTDAFIGEIAQAKNQVELSRTAWERGHNNADARYLWRMVDILNEATVRDGLRIADISLYLDQMRVIETQGLSGSRGESARQARLILDAMKKRLGADFAKVEAFAAKFRAVHEQELVNDPVLERVMGKGTADYWRSQTHYVTTKRQFSPEELAEIEVSRKAVAAANGGGDDIVGAMYKYLGKPDATARLKGSFSDKQEVISATLEKVAAIKKYLRRCEYVIELRDLLMKAKVEGVHDYAAGKNEFPNNKRYGAISYMENGQKRTLVVPREIADGFKAQGDYNNTALKLCSSVNNIARQLWIDWNPVYWQRNLSRNAGSIEMNMPGMRESIIKRGTRFIFPGLAPVTEIAMTHLVRHMPERMSLTLRRIWGEHTALFYAPKAKRMAMWLTDHNEMQRRYWEAEKRGDLGAIQEMDADRRDMLEALKANMLVGISAGKASGTNGFLDESVKTVGKTMLREIQDAAAKPKWRKALDAVNIFAKNAEQQVFEDVAAKFSAYLHDRAQFGKGNNRTAQESGLVVKQNVSIGEGERRGQSAGWIQGLMQPFWNMVEKGVTRNVRAYSERPGETMEKAAWRIAPMILHGLVGGGALAAWILRANDGDEERAKSGPMGAAYRYARACQRAYQNCSKYVRENYHFTPLWTEGYTSIVMGMPLTDEERLLKPVARLVADAANVASGTKAEMEISSFMSDAYGTVAPDFKMAGALVTLLDDTVHALVDNPTDYYTGGKKYDNDLWLARNESWGMRGKFLAAMGMRLWNDFGGRNVLPVERGGVDNGLGRAPGWVASMVNDIPIASPILRSFVKVQVGSPKRDAAEIDETEAKRRAVGRVCAKQLFEEARKSGRDVSLDAERYIGQLEKWRKTYGLTDDELAYIEAHYLNAWREYEGAQYRAEGEREKSRAKAERLGLDRASIWLDFD